MSHIAVETEMEPEANKTERDYFLAKHNYYLPPKVSMGLSTHDLELVNGSKNQVTVELPVYDVRGHETKFKVDVHGFQFMRVSSILGLRDFDFDEKIQE